MPQDGLVKGARNQPAQTHATPVENAFKVHANVSQVGPEKHAKSKSAPTSALPRPTENVTLKPSSAPAKKDLLEKTVARKLAQRTVTVTVNAKMAFACARTCGLVNHANSQRAPTLAVATECALVISVNVTRNSRATIAVFANAQMPAPETVNATKNRLLANAVKVSQVKTVDSRHAQKTATTLTVSAN